LKFKMVGGNNKTFSCLNILNSINNCKKSRELEMSKITITSRSTSFFYLNVYNSTFEENKFLEVPTLDSCINTIKLNSLAKPVNQVRGTYMTVKCKDPCSLSFYHVVILK